MNWEKRDFDSKYIIWKACKKSGLLSEVSGLPVRPWMCHQGCVFSVTHTNTPALMVLVTAPVSHQAGPRGIRMFWAPAAEQLRGFCRAEMSCHFKVSS